MGHCDRRPSILCTTQRFYQFRPGTSAVCSCEFPELLASAGGGWGGCGCGCEQLATHFPASHLCVCVSITFSHFPYMFVFRSYRAIQSICNTSHINTYESWLHIFPLPISLCVFRSHFPTSHLCLCFDHSKILPSKVYVPQ